MELSPLAWFSIGVILAALEIVTPGFVIFWFGIGGVFTALLVFLGILKSAEAQWLFFFLSSMAFLGLWFGVLKKRLRPDGPDSSRDPTVTGLKGRCVRRITPTIPGEVELYESFHGIRVWQAESVETIEEEDEITVAEAKGIKLVVNKNS